MLPRTGNRTVKCAPFAASLLLLFGMALPVVAEPSRTVLIFYGENRLHPAITVFDENFRSAVQEGAGQPVEFLTEFLDVGRFPDDRYETLLTDFLRRKYLGRPVDLIVAGGPTALKFLLRHREQILPKVPIVHAAVTSAQLRALAPPPDVVGMPVDPDPVPTIELAQRLHPKARRLVLVTGTSAWDRDWERLLREAIPRFPKQVQVEFLAGLPMAELQERLRSLSSDAIVFVPSFFQDGAGVSFVVHDAVTQIATASAVPVYGPSGAFIGTGMVGGYMPTLEAIAQQTGEIVQRLLHGVPPSALHLLGVQRNAYVVDGRQLHRWSIDEKALPAGTIVQFREPTFWETYRERIVAAAAVVLLQVILIAVLLLERRSRRQAIAELQASKKRMNLAANATGVGMWVWNIARDNIWATPQARALYGIGESEPIDIERFLHALHPADRESTKKTLDDALATGNDFELQYRVVHPEGEIRWHSARGQVEFGESGQRCSVVGVSLDITGQKTAELAAERHRSELVHLTRVGLVGHLSAAIAHELNQPLTAILSNAQAAQRLLRREPADLEEVREIFQDVIDENQRAVEIIRRLRSLFNRGELQRQPLDLSEVAREVLTLAHSDILTRNVTLVAELANGLPAVPGDRVHLQQVLLNLIVNACEAMAANEPDQRSLRVRTENVDGTEVRISVADCGKGLCAEGLGRIFEPLFTTKAHGMGMGLAISRSIVEAHGGRLLASNDPKGGATFEVFLPTGEGNCS